MTHIDHMLARQFLALLQPDVRRQLEAVPEVEDLLNALFRSAADAWTTIALPSDLVLPYLAKRLPLGPSLERALRNWCVDDLYLCCACAAGDRQAIAAFRQHFGPVLLATLNGLRLNQVLIEDVQQHVMLQLLAGSERKAPMITDFGGLGKLSRWLRVVTARTARKMLHREKKLVPVDDDHLADKLSIDTADADLQRIKQIYRKEFKSAFKQALTQLPAQQVNLIRYRFGEGLTLQQIGEIYRVHHSTVLRRLDQVKRELLEQTHDLLRERLDVTQNECLSVIRLIQSNFDLTLQTFLSGDKIVGPGTEG